MHGAIEKEKAGLLVRVRIRLFLTKNKGRYVNRPCMEYTSNFHGKSLLPNDTIKEEEDYYEKTSF